jgi:lipoate-protein ligase A
MKYLDLTLPSAAENLACDEVLLDRCEVGLAGEVIRFWEPRSPFVVAGYANQVKREVDLAACRRLGVPVLRRCSGGGTVLQGPGCLNYSLVLQIQAAAPTKSISETNRFILERHAAVFQALLGKQVQIQGQTDLAVGNLKFSGNAQRRRHKSLIFHGTFLLDFDLSLVAKVLPMPSKQPEYREGRSHQEFLVNLHVSAAAVKAALMEAWGARETLAEPPMEQIAKLVREKYSTEEWNLKF